MVQIHNNEITVNRGEAFTMRKIIQNRDGSPYIVSSRLKNPHWLVTVASSLYEQKDRYVLNKWLSLKNLPRFEITRPVKLSDYGLKFEDSTLPFMENGVLTSGEIDFTGDETLGYANIAIFYEKDENGVISYKYWEYNNNEEGDFNGHWVDYDCKITTTFGTSITSEWVRQSYFYSIRLVDGELSGELDKPLERLDLEYSILSYTKLTVKSNLWR